MRFDNKLRAAILALACLTLTSEWLTSDKTLPVVAHAQVSDTQDGNSLQISGIPASPSSTSTVNFAELAQQQAAGVERKRETFVKSLESPPSPPEPYENTKTLSRAEMQHAEIVAADDMAGVQSGGGAASPFPSLSYQAQPDTNQVIPPGPHGAVGLNKVMSTLNSNYTIQDKTSGTVLSNVSTQSFWASTGATGVFDPKTLYDPYNNRWLLTAVSNRQSATSSILVGISQTSDPSGNYNLYRYDVDSGDALWADYPCIGFNKNWLVISVNAFSISNNTFSQGRVLALDYPTLRAGTFSGLYFTGISNAGGGFSMQPAVTYSATEETEYLVSNLNSGLATYRFFTITGTPSQPALSNGVTKTNALGGWTQPGGETLPQAPETGGTGTRKIESRDARIINAVFRNGSIYFSQTVGLPAGRTPATIDRTAAQWVQANVTGDFLQGGRIEDPTATPTNGGKWYAFPSLSVNGAGDVLMGFTQFASNQFASAGYSFRAATDASGTMREPVVFKAGGGYYEKTGSGTVNRWGEYSNTAIDPANDRDLWTIQEYAAAPVGTGNGSGRWGTWWARVALLRSKIAFVSYRDGNAEIYTMNPDGSQQTRLTNNAADDTDPNWSPDGTKIAFMRGYNGVYLMNADGSNQIWLSNGGLPSWSPDGTKIAFYYYGDIYVMNADGSNQVNITGAGLSSNGGYNLDPGWSPDGTKIASMSQLGEYDFVTRNPDGSGFTRLTYDRRVDGETYAWSPDSSKIVYSSLGQIYVVNRDGTNDHQLTTTAASYNPVWSPDGSRILYNRYGALMLMNQDGSNQTALGTGYGGAWSPDGSRIAFSRANGYVSSIEIYTVSPDGTNELRLTFNSGEDTNPVWQP